MDICCCVVRGNLNTYPVHNFGFFIIIFTHYRAKVDVRQNSRTFTLTVRKVRYFQIDLTISVEVMSR